MKEKIIPVISVVIGILAFVTTSQYISRQKDLLEKERMELLESARKTYVVVATHDIPSGARIKQTDLARTSILAKYVTDDMVLPEDAETILGKKTVQTIIAEKPISWYFIEGGRSSAGGLADTITPGMRAISLPISGSATVSGMVRPNDRVDVIGTFSMPYAGGTQPDMMETVTLTILQDVSVIATGQRMAKQALSDQPRSSSYSYNTVTLEVTPREAELLVFLQQTTRGAMFLSLRHPEDVNYEKELPTVNFSHLQNELPKLNQYRQQTIRRKPSR